jgi:hypothetical protein
MNPEEAFKYRDLYLNEPPTDVHVSRDRSISILIDLDSHKKELFEFLGENRFVVAGGVSREVYACLEFQGDKVD